MPDLILASGSAYRRQLLERLRLNFSCDSPDIDESPLVNELPEDTALRLARLKAEAVAARHPGAWIIGSDQVGCLDGERLGTPGSSAAACAKLQQASGRWLHFHTGLCLLQSGSGTAFSALDTCSVLLRRLDSGQIARYVALEQPLDCAGSFKSEGLGIALFERIRGDDPTALIGLPLIRLSELLQRAGMPVI